MIKKPEIVDAIMNLRPSSAFILENDDYSRLEWKDASCLPPSLQEVQSELARLESEFAKKQYSNFREKEYPSIREQLDILYHSGYEGWKESIKAVKDKYPKDGEA